MAQYFFSVSKAERENILDQHKHVYDGFVTTYGQNINSQPLYVQDLANDKGGITLSNKGVVTTYKNFGINENVSDRIGDGPYDLKNGTVDLDSLGDTFDKNTEFMHDVYPSPNEDENDITIISLGQQEEDPEFDFSVHEPSEDNEYKPYYEFDIEELGDFDSAPIESLYHEVDDDIVEEFNEKLNESLDMFRRFKKYN